MFCLLFKYTCENLSLLREMVLLSSVCKYRLSAGTLRSKRGDRFTSVPLCNYSSLAGSDLIYQGRSTRGSILSRIILKNSHQLNFTAEKLYGYSSNYCHLLIYTNSGYAKHLSAVYRSVYASQCYDTANVHPQESGGRNLSAHLNSRGGSPL